MTNDLNTSIGLRLSVALAYLVVMLLLLSAVWPAAAYGAAAALIAVIGLNWRYYAWFVRQRGWLFATRVVPAHLVYHLCNGLSFMAGTLAYLRARPDAGRH